MRLAIDADPVVRVVVIKGSGPKAFSAGADVVAWSSLAPPDMWRTRRAPVTGSAERLESLRQPTIAAQRDRIRRRTRAGTGLRSATCCGPRSWRRPRSGSRPYRLGHDDPVGHDRRLCQAKQMIRPQPDRRGARRPVGLVSKSSQQPTSTLRRTSREPDRHPAPVAAGRQAADRRQPTPDVPGAGRRVDGIHRRRWRGSGGIPRATTTRIRRL
jgi:hypothetical protein